MTRKETIKQLEEELEGLKKENTDLIKIKKLKQEIRAYKFTKTKTGKFIDKVGAFGEKAGKRLGIVGKKIFAQRPQQQGKGKKKVKTVKDVNKSIQDAMDKFPQ